ncbi:MAG: carboxypeptidase-like regulatory domain-containing protein [Bacteroidales bacterium]
MINKLFATSVLLGFCFGLLSQEVVITGVVIDQETGEPLTGAAVKHCSSGEEVITDFDGCFTISSAETGKNELTVSYVSYDDAKLNRVIVKKGEPTKLNIKMRRVGSELPAKSFLALSVRQSQV